ncbi:hypothetical protein BBJ29_006231 [Phytophthora kernoviae]|uniref:Splicing factor Cactin n=1 Tax=Phytophthora kernoviae TaxID=325452 RepID=A0A3F2RGM3_9STRA|nr:hypothetical protein BBJ29_006231 [Phytophthora kernoviae]RLN56450.1 hypothetical protein BBP00_00008003 [Phytophthora kernoviae]
MARSDDSSSRHRRSHDHHNGKKKHKKRRHRSDSDSSESEARAERKTRKKSAKMLASFGYSDETNPFGDSSLSQPFVWGKKYSDKGRDKPTVKELKKQQLQRVDEIRKARKRREEREEEREEMERLKSEEMRLKDAEQYEDWQQKEEAFHLKQTKELEESGNGAHNAEFWKLMRLVCDDRVRRLKRSQSEGREGRGAIHDSVTQTIEEMLEGKDAEGLHKLEEEVRDTIASASNGATGVDLDFWEEVKQQVEVYQARTRLTELHEEMLTKLADLMEEHERRTAEEAAARATEDETAGVVDENGRDAGREAREMERSFARKGMDEAEEQLGTSEEVALAESKEAPSWSEKYQPRKPRYFNRVKTGYDWNKYNQTHYDRDNPPPKVVQGYKFNLFYPDLIDKHTSPRFFLEKTSSPEFCIIRFSAGPPYQDIAFKIVNREWEYSHKRGFKSVFERGILHVYFNFKRHRYRR